MLRVLLNNKLLGQLMFLILGIFAVVFYLERTTFVDPAWVVLKLTIEKTFEQEVGRYAAVIPQLFPLAGIWLGLSLKSILLLYSLSFIVLYYIIFLIIAYVLKNDTIALAVPIILIMGIRDSFFWIPTETHQTLVYNLLFFAFLYHAFREPTGFIRTIRNLIPAILILFLCFFTHPVSLFTVLFILGYFAFDTRSWRSPVVYILAAMITGMAFFKLSIVPQGGYESGFFASFFSFFEKIRHLPDSKSFQFIGDHITLYIFHAIIFITILVVFLQRKRYLLLAYVVLSACLFMAVVFVTFDIYFVQFIQEKNIMPLNIFLLIPFMNDVTCRTLRCKQVKQGFLVALFVFSIVNITIASAAYRDRIGHVRHLIKKASQFPETKFIVEEQYLNPDHFRVYWGIPFETLVLSALEDPDSAKTIYVLYNHEVLGDTVDLNNPSLFLSIQNYPFFIFKQYLDTNYFNLGTSAYRTLEKHDIYSQMTSRIVYLNHFNDTTFTESNDSCFTDSTGTSFFLMTHEFGPGLVTTYGALTDKPNLWITATAKMNPFEACGSSEIPIVITREKDSKIFDYITSHYSSAPAIRPDQWNEIKASGVFRDARKDDIVKVYIWNPGKKKIRVDDLMVTVETE